MWGFLRDKWRSVQLHARYQRLIQEQVLGLIETRGPEPVAEDPGQWSLLGNGKPGLPEAARLDLRMQARQLVQKNPYARNVLRLLEVYVAGPGMQVSAVARSGSTPSDTLLQDCARVWERFLKRNRRHFSYVETARRTWRDGECFLRLFPHPDGPPAVRYVDPEMVAATPEAPDTQGLICDPDDVETVWAYQLVDPVSGEALEQVDATQMLHLRINVDSNERRGISLFASVLDGLACFEKWLETELQARKLQASIVLWRKVQGAPSQVTAAADQLRSSTVSDPWGATRRERYRPGTILTTSQGTDLQFLSPNTNFGDAVPLGRLVLLGIAAGAGVPEYMITCDASNANFSSTMVAEGPAVKLFESEQQALAQELETLWDWVLQDAARRGELPGDVLEQVRAKWTFPQLISRDRARERQADAQLVEAGVLSRSEVARRDGVSPDVMFDEIQREPKSAG